MRRFYAIPLSLLLLTGLFLGCNRQGPPNDVPKPPVVAPILKIDPPVQPKDVNPKNNGDTPKKLDDDKDEKYTAALDEALSALAKREWNGALAAFEAARLVNDTEFVQSEIAKLKQRIEQDGTSKTTLKNIQTVLDDGKAEEAIKLIQVALREFGDGDDAAALVKLRLQAEALQGVEKKEDKDARYIRLKKEGELALEENPRNLRAAALAFEQALQGRDGDALQPKYDSIRADLDKYDALRKKALDLRRDAGSLEDALAALTDAKAVWDTPQIQAEINECQLAKEKGRDTITVANFDLRNDVGMPGAGSVFADELLPLLKAKFDLVERDQLNRVIGELKIEQGVSDELKLQQQLGKLARVRYLVVGNVSRLVVVTVRARVIDVRTGLVVQTGKISAPTMQEVIDLAPDLAKQLMMTDDEKMQVDARPQAKAPDVVADDAVPPPPPLPPEMDAPPPLPIPLENIGAPGFGNMKGAAFKVLAPEQEAEPLVVQRRNRLLFATLEMGDFLFRAGRFGDARRQFEFALVLSPDNLDVQLRLERVRPIAPPFVPYLKPRIAVLPFMASGNPFVVPPSLGYWTPTNLAPYFSSRYEVVDPTEIYWYMARVGMTMNDLMIDPNARRWLGRAVGVRYFVLGSCIETTSFDVNTYLLDTELGTLQGQATINVRTPYELKLRLPELAELTMMSLAERDAYLQAAQYQRFVNLVADGRQHLDQRRYREAMVEFGRALEIYPNNVQVQYWFTLSQDRVRFEDFELAARRRYDAQQEARAAQRQRQVQLAQDAAQARRQAIAEAAGRTDEQRKTHFLFRFQARDAMITQARFELKTNRFGVSVSLFQGAMDFAPPQAAGVPAPAPVPAAVYRELAQARLRSEGAEQLRNAQIAAAREETLRKVREQQLAEAQRQLEAERIRAREKLAAVRAAQVERDDQAFKAGMKQGQRYMSESKYEAALAAFQGAQRLGNGPKQNEQVNNLIDVIVQRQAESLARTQEQKKALEVRFEKERDRRKNAETQAKQNEEAYRVALQAAQQALAAKNPNLDVAQAKFEEAKVLYKTDAVLAGLQTIQSARAAAITVKQSADTELKKADTVKQMIAAGNASLDAKKYPEAVQTFQQAKKLAPTNLDVMTGLTRAEEMRNRLQSEANRKAEEAGRTQNFQRLVKSGQENLAAKHYEAAVANLSDALKLNPTDATALDAMKKAQQGHDALLTDATAKAAAAKRAEAYQKNLSAGQAALASKRYADAINAFDAAQNVLPGDKASKDYLQEAQTAKKTADAAIVVAVKQRADDMKIAADVRKALTQGRTALAAKDFAGAGKLLNQAKALNPNDPDVQKALRDLDQAVQRAGAEATAAKERLTQFQTLLATGKDALNGKRYPEAISALSRANTLMPDSKDAQDLYRRAQTESAQAALGDKQKQADYQAALSAGQKAYVAMNFAAAIKSYEQALTLMPKDLNATKGLQQATDALNFAAKAGADFAKAIDAGQKAMTAKSYGAAVKAFGDATRLNPNDANAKAMLAQAQLALTEANRQAAIVANYQKAMTAGQVAMTTKKYAQAITSYKDALMWVPNDKAATQQLQAATQALADLPKVKTPPDPAKQYADAMQRGAAAAKKKDYEIAAKAYDEAVKLRPKDADAQAGFKQNQYLSNMQLGQQYLDNSQWMLAEAEFQSALRLFPNDQNAQKLLKKAKSKMK